MNELTDFDIARLLSDSLKYVRLYRNHTVVVKYGGNAMKNPELQQQVMHDLVLLSMIGIRIVLVHGGGPSINKSLAALGIESKFVRGLRVTDEETMRVVQRVLAGETNKDLVKLLCAEGSKDCADLTQVSSPHDPKRRISVSWGTSRASTSRLSRRFSKRDAFPSSRP